MPQTKLQFKPTYMYTCTIGEQIDMKILEILNSHAHQVSVFFLSEFDTVKLVELHSDIFADRSKAVLLLWILFVSLS